MNKSHKQMNQNQFNKLVCFTLKAPYSPTGDQPQAIKKMVTNIKNKIKRQVLLGATGTGKTFSVANVIAQIT